MNEIEIIKNFSEIEDIEKVTSLIQAQFNSYGVTKASEEVVESLKNALSDKSRSVLFLINGNDNNPIGFSFVNVCSGLESGGDYIWINELFIRGNNRKKGLGRKIIKFIENWCSDEGIRYISLATGTTNLNAQKFYKNIGYDVSEAIWVDKSL